PPTAETGAAKTIARVASFELVEQGRSESSSRCPERMTDGNGPAIDIHFCPIKFKFLFHGKILTGESFIDLDEIHFLESEAGSIQGHFHGGNRSDAHHRGFAPGDAPGDDSGQRLDSSLSGFV